MLGYSKTILMGNLGADPIVRSTPGGVKVATITLATHKVWFDDKKQKQETTEWHRIVVWRGAAEIVAKYLRKGSPLFVEGENKTRKWSDSQGQDRYTTEVHASEIRLLGGGNREDVPAAAEHDTEALAPEDYNQETRVSDASEIPF